jgi:hypothetical protein
MKKIVKVEGNIALKSVVKITIKVGAKIEVKIAEKCLTNVDVKIVTNTTYLQSLDSWIQHNIIKNHWSLKWTSKERNIHSN